MLIRIDARSDGIREYLVKGVKQGREEGREELDKRVVLSGDIDLTHAVIENSKSLGDRYLHITLSFKEDIVDEKTLGQIAKDFESYMMAAYRDDEYNYYAEAHLPRIKSYQDKKTGELVERKPHIHVVVPRVNLLTGGNLDPLGYAKRNIKYIDAFQEYVNKTYGLASPKDNLRKTFFDRSDALSRYKGDTFNGLNKDFKEGVLKNILDKKISSKAELIEHLQSLGSVRYRNFGREDEYLNVKPSPESKGINLKEEFFKDEFLKLSNEEKLSRLGVDITPTENALSSVIEEHYSNLNPSASVAQKQFDGTPYSGPSVASQQPKTIGGLKSLSTIPAMNSAGSLELGRLAGVGRLHKEKVLMNEWTTERAFVEKYIRWGSVEHKSYLELTADEKIQVLEEKINQFYNNHEVLKNESTKQFSHSDKYDLTKSPTGKATQTINNMRNLSSIPMVRDTSRGEVLLSSNARDNLVNGGTGRDDRVRRSNNAPEGRQGRRGVLTNVPRNAAEIHLYEVPSGAVEINRQIMGDQLLKYLESTHGLLSDRYGVKKWVDGSDRISIDKRNYSASDFLTKEMHLKWPDAEKILTEVMKHQELNSNIKSPAGKDLWSEFADRNYNTPNLKGMVVALRRELLAMKKTDMAIYKTSKEKIKYDRSLTPNKRKEALSLLRVSRVESDTNRAKYKKEREDEITRLRKQSVDDRYRMFLHSKAVAGDANALLELRRLGGFAPSNHRNAIKPTKVAEWGANIIRFKDLDYHVELNGNVMYSRDGSSVVRDTHGSIDLINTDSDSIALALRMAYAKYGRSLNVTGGHELKERIATVAAKTGLNVVFSDKRMNEKITEILQEQKRRSIEKVASDPAKKPTR